MRGAAAAAVALATGSMMLGGCQSFLGSKLFAVRPAKVNLAAVDMSDYFQELVDTGKADLMHGRISDAIVAFRQASYDPKHAGDAFNGMGVAYAELGRADLARRYFAQALAADPSDPRFARNLARLDLASEPALAEAAPAQGPQQAEAPAIAAVAAVIPASGFVAAAEPAPAIRIEQSAPVLERVSAKEVRIAALQVVPVSRPAEVRLSTYRLADRSASSPAVQGASHVQASGLIARQAYPVRLAISEMSDKNRNTYRHIISAAAE